MGVTSSPLPSPLPLPLDRRLCPDISFFQRATEYPCLLILDPQNEFETLRKRVEQTTLKSQTVARNRSGVTNVRGNLGPQGLGVTAFSFLGPLGCWPQAIWSLTVLQDSYPKHPWPCQAHLQALSERQVSKAGCDGCPGGPGCAAKEPPL